MKPLKEIGFRVTPNENSVTQYEPYTTFTDEERRELVRGVIMAILKSMWTPFTPDDKSRLDDAIEEFLKSEGL